MAVPGGSAMTPPMVSGLFSLLLKIMVLPTGSCPEELLALRAEMRRLKGSVSTASGRPLMIGMCNISMASWSAKQKPSS
ncbi:MAG: hypothetical protein QM664_00555 [Flavihumibacter sp.]